MRIAYQALCLVLGAFVILGQICHVMLICLHEEDWGHVGISHHCA